MVPYRPGTLLEKLFGEGPRGGPIRPPASAT